MANAKSSSRGNDLARRLSNALARASKVLNPGARDLPIILGLTPKCVFTRPQENVLFDTGRILVASSRIFRLGNEVVCELVDGADRRLVTLASDGVVEPSAAAILANIFVCQIPVNDESVLQFAPPRGFVALLLNSSPVAQVLPSIKTYSRRPIFDDEFNLLGPGWHPEQCVLVHGPEVDPVCAGDPDPDLPVLDRLPPHLRTLLGGFCFREAADAANMIAALLTAILVNIFISVGKPVFLIDGNQPGLGKTLLARILGILMDGADPSLIPYTSDDEELGKKICATLRGGLQSAIIVDNAKNRSGEKVNSRIIESITTAPRIELRILGLSANFSRPNDVIVAFTMNDTKASPDLVSRSVPVRLHFDGDPRHRTFDGPEPIEFAMKHRIEILGELAGLIIRWSQQGRPAGQQEHRFGPWARTVGGILETAGIPEFLKNLDDAATSFDEVLDELAALAETALSADFAHLIVTPSN